MNNIEEYIKSGMLESYVLGMTSPQEEKEVEEFAIIHPEIRAAINELSEAIENYALSNTVAPDPLVKPMLMATIDYIERMKNGETATFPPILHEGSRIADYMDWLDRSDMILPTGFKDIYAKIISHTPQVTSAIVWIKEMAPQEVHKDEFEKFLIVEGTCNITIGDNVHTLVPGDYLNIPLHINHFVQVTSDIPCKVILQRIAA